jgi:hypothetical protein
MIHARRIADLARRYPRLVAVEPAVYSTSRPAIFSATYR